MIPHGIKYHSRVPQFSGRCTRFKRNLYPYNYKRMLPDVLWKCIFAPKGPVDNNSALVQLMAWCCEGDKPLPAPMLTQLHRWNHQATINTLRPRQNGRHFTNHIFKCISLNEKISLKFVPKGSINNIPALVQIMARRRPGNKPLSEPMRVSLSTHICVTLPQWVNKYLSRVLQFSGICARFERN